MDGRITAVPPGENATLTNFITQTQPIFLLFVKWKKERRKHITHTVSIKISSSVGSDNCRSLEDRAFLQFNGVLLPHHGNDLISHIDLRIRFRHEMHPLVNTLRFILDSICNWEVNASI